MMVVECVVIWFNEEWLTPRQALDHKCHFRCSSPPCEFFLSPDVEVACQRSEKWVRWLFDSKHESVVKRCPSKAASCQVCSSLYRWRVPEKNIIRKRLLLRQFILYVSVLHCKILPNGTANSKIWKSSESLEASWSSLSFCKTRNCSDPKTTDPYRVYVYTYIYKVEHRTIHHYMKWQSGVKRKNYKVVSTKIDACLSTKKAQLTYWRKNQGQ